ncbi:MAG: HAMP domain-containing sensor histidine kinase [Bacilli bacterium]
MSYFNDILLCCTLLCFPLFIYFFFLSCNVENEKEEDDIMFSIALFTSFYLIFTRGIVMFPRISVLMSNVLIILAYVRKKNTSAILLSIFYIVSLYFKYKISLPLLIFEYLILYFLFYIKNKRKISCYIMIIIFFTIKFGIYFFRQDAAGTFFDDSIFNDKMFISIPLVCLTTIILIYFLELANKIIKRHSNYTSLKKEEQIKQSLFKISHEIKNPLAVCKGYLSMLDINNKDKVTRYIPIIETEINHALLILQDFSYLSKIRIEKKDISIKSLLKDITTELKEILKNNKIKLEYEKTFDATINADYDRMKQVLLNIMKNSIEALETKKSKKKIIIKLKDTKKYLTMNFIDNGVGSSIYDIDHLGEPFYTTKQNGTGLGITFSKEILSHHNGTIKFISTENEGMEVIIKIKK